MVPSKESLGLRNLARTLPDVKAQQGWHPDEGGSLYEGVRSRAASSAGSAASRSSYVSFGSRKGRKLAFRASLACDTPTVAGSTAYPKPRQSLPRRVPAPKPLSFQCTFCGMCFRTKYLWQRHEEAVHSPPKIWVCEALTFWPTISDCPVCVFETPLVSKITRCPHRFVACWEKPESVRRFFREDGFIAHLRGMHSAGTHFSWPYQARVVEVPKENLMCPFCGVESPTWSQRVEHVAKHFRDGEQLPAFGMEP